MAEAVVGSDLDAGLGELGEDWEEGEGGGWWLEEEEREREVGVERRTMTMTKSN